MRERCTGTTLTKNKTNFGHTGFKIAVKLEWL